MTQKQLLFIMAGLAILAAGWIYYKKRKAAAQPMAKDLTRSNDLGPAIEPVPMDQIRSNEPAPANDKFPLKQGSTGKRVEQLQQFLQSRKGAKFPKFGIDGVFGQETLENVQKLLGISEVTEPIFKTNRISDFKTYVYKS
ncbi:peptidoglycan-binding protein [Rhodocytophaga aerolata]